jgi:glycosyltransferase involved in cell wall biosynthesis
MKEENSQQKKLVLGIDASNIRAGGGVTHLVEILKHVDISVHGFSKVILWSGKKTLDQITDRVWLEKSYEPLLNKSLFHRTFWQKFRLTKCARQNGCDLLFVPGGSYSGSFRPMATFSQNLLPFEWKEIKRYGISMATLRLLLLHISQSRTFKKADGVIFLTRFAREVVMRSIKHTRGITATIAHGIDERYVCAPRPQLPVDQYSQSHPFKIVYVSTVDIYKHQWNVVKAVAALRRKGLPVTLDLVGSAYKPALKKLKKTLHTEDPLGEFAHYLGVIPYEKLHTTYAQAQLSVFASSCETFGMILTEAMSSGLPIACSNKSAMTELLGDAGMYFNPEKSREIVEAMEKLILSAELRAQMANKAFQQARSFSWNRCADETFQFLYTVAVAEIKTKNSNEHI